MMVSCTIPQATRTGELPYRLQSDMIWHRGALIAAPLVSLGGYPTLFAGTAVVGLLGSILVWRIKSVP